MRTVAVRRFTALLGVAIGIGMLAMSAQAMAADHIDDNAMSYARVIRVDPLYAAAVYHRDPPHAGGYRHARADRQYCATVADGAYREEVVAYRVYYRYHGHDLVREMAYDPGPLLKVHANIETDD